MTAVTATAAHHLLSDAPLERARSPAPSVALGRRARCRRSDNTHTTAAPAAVRARSWEAHQRSAGRLDNARLLRGENRPRPLARPQVERNAALAGHHPRRQRGEPAAPREYPAVAREPSAPARAAAGGAPA